MRRIFILLLFIPVFLLALESEPSEVVGYVKYECGVAGYQFIANSMATGYTLASELGDAIGTTNCNSISIWNASTQTWDITVYNHQMWFDDQPIIEGAVIMCGMLNPVDVYMAGALPTLTSYPLQFGYSSIMIPLDRSDIITASQLGNEIGLDKVNSINTWDADSQSWVTTVYNHSMWFDDQLLEIGTPILLGVISDYSWPIIRDAEQTEIVTTEGVTK